MTVPYSFGAATSAIPLSQLDSNFNTPITLGNTAIQLGNTVTTLNNMTLANVTISSGSVTFATANAVVYTNSSNTATTSTALTFDGTNLGIGTSSPGAKLDVQAAQGRIKLTSTTGTNNTLLFLNNSGGNAYVGLDNSAGGLTSAYALNIFHEGAYPIIFSTNNTERMRLDSSGNLGLGVTPSAWGSNYRVLDGFGTNSGGGSVAFNTSYTMILATNLYNDNTNWRWKASGINGSTITLDNSGQCIWTRYAGNNTAGLIPSSATQAMTLDASGNLLVGKTADNDNVGVITYSVGSTYIVRDGGSCLGLNRLNSDGTIATFFRSTTTVGTISVTTTATAYNTSSDYRLKENIQPMTGALAKVAALKPCTYKWKADGSDGEGFIAHELQAVVPQCVTGEKDAVDADNKPVYQGIDTSFLVATLTAALQEQQALIQTLTERITALEGAK